MSVKALVPLTVTVLSDIPWMLQGQMRTNSVRHPAVEKKLLCWKASRGAYRRPETRRHRDQSPQQSLPETWMREQTASSSRWERADSGLPASVSQTRSADGECLFLPAVVCLQPPLPPLLCSSSFFVCVMRWGDDVRPLSGAFFKPRYECLVQM